MAFFFKLFGFRNTGEGASAAAAASAAPNATADVPTAPAGAAASVADESAPAADSNALWRKIGPDAHGVIMGFLPSAQTAEWRRLSRFHYAGGKAGLLRVKSQEFLQHVVLGHYSDVKRILSLTTDQEILRALLTYTGTVKASSRQRLKGSALGLALAAGDVDYKDERGRQTVDGMAELIRLHLPRITEEGEDLIASQISAQFPEGWQAEEDARHIENRAALRKVREAIANPDISPEVLEEAFATFRNHIDRTLKHTIVFGNQWDARLLAEALELGDREFANFNNVQNNHYYKKVVGYLQRHAPDNVAQVFAQGLLYVGGEAETLSRRLNYRCGNGSYFPLGVPLFGLGHDYYCGRSAAGDRASVQPRNCPGAPPGLGADLGLFQHYVRAKATALEELLLRGQSHSRTPSAR